MFDWLNWFDLPEWVYAVFWGNIIGAISVVCVMFEGLYFPAVTSVVTLAGFVVYWALREARKWTKKNLKKS